MFFGGEYMWVDATSFFESFLFHRVLSWENTSSSVIATDTLVDVMTTPFFKNTKVSLLSHTNVSFMDVFILFSWSADAESAAFLHKFYWAIIEYLDTNFIHYDSLYYADCSTQVVILMYYNPELLESFLYFYVEWWLPYVGNFLPGVVYDLFNDSVTTIMLNVMKGVTATYFIFMGVIFIKPVSRLLPFGVYIDSFLTRFFNYIYYISTENRIQYDTALHFLTFSIFYWIFALASLDDDHMEFIEVYHLAMMGIFLTMIFYLIYKYSTHYFAFLEASVVDGSSSAPATKQFVRDMTNTFALMLRFFLLLFRLNIYDGLDDFVDSYYIFLADFDEDEYYSETVFPMDSVLFYTPDTNDDSMYSYEEESEFFFDIFSLYYVVWGKLFFFCLFILEEFFRVSLALYITYLIIFEVHSVNSSLTEDIYISVKRT